ncbi:hypothetical protein C8J56DRAFT_1105000 [Mycena floridula]|nr:hypothetical protein C8J56DRAFT_1105000 [Mycena floridula]
MSPGMILPDRGMLILHISWPGVTTAFLMPPSLQDPSLQHIAGEMLLLTMDVRRKEILFGFEGWLFSSLSASQPVTALNMVAVYHPLIRKFDLRTGASIATTVYMELKPEFSQFPSFRASPVTWLVSSAVADVLITGVLVYSLHKKKSGLNTCLDVYVNHIIQLTIALSEALVFVAVKDTTIFFAWDLSLSKLYLNTILSSLNARDTWKNGANALYPSDLDDLPELHAPIGRRGNQT